MKMKKIYSAVLAVLLALSLALQAYAEGEGAPSAPEEAPVQTPEEPGPADPEPPAWLLPPEEGEQPAGTPEAPEAPAVPENPDDPENTEPPAEQDPPETPSDPEPPAVPETPAGLEMPIIPETPSTPEDPFLPPAWLLPPDQLPVQTAPNPQAPVEVPVTVQEAPTIDVTVPAASSAVINPYGLPVTLEDRETTEQIAGNTMLLENRSTVAVDVSASAVGTVTGDVVFAYQTPMPDSVAKEVFLYAEFWALSPLDAEIPWTGSFTDSSNQLLVTPYGTAKDALMRLDAAGMPYSQGAVRLFGSVTAYPAQPWQEGDGFQVNLAFTFTPVAEAVPVEVPDASFDAAFLVPPDTGFDEVQTVTPDPALALFPELTFEVPEQDPASIPPVEETK